MYQEAITVGPYTTPLECEANLPDAVREAVEQYVELSVGPQAARGARWFDDRSCRELIKDRWEEVRQSSVGPMTQLHLLLRFDQKIRDHIFKAGVVGQRLWLIAVGLTGGLGLLAVAFGYLKIDGRTGGAYRGRLSLAAAFAILGLIAAVVIGMAA